ncbi:LysM domain-containing protein [Curtobacterium sp. PhB130]|uniref:LysM peptidoglycan-binding domain-containing protein n=1 Tax=unclassified Curtobacterium TaxID=257496 RepID=UPI000F4C217F|nr:MULTISPECIES: LysM peptidoglycan-binding domain-containing protein [unclassified Curtobacterium]ROS71886.1 LysM domain-containing protein [Curtobacterium sp. PhB130]TCK58277.1 LysM domain-containing protein [Curtobacterium sp. PhB136]
MRRFITGFGALIAIVAVLVGVPIVLIIAAGNPLPTGAQLQSVITLTPDYGNTILLTKLLPCAGWVAWVLFAVPFLIELAATITGRPTKKRLPIFRGQQHVAAALIAAVLVMFAGGTMIGTAQPANAAPAPVTTVTSQPAETSAAAPAAPRAPPAVETPAPAAPSVTTKTVHHTVVPGDNLWSIAEQYYGDGTRDLDIFNASTATVQPDGQHLTNPNLLRPGWNLTVPNVAVTQTPAPAPKPAAPAPSPSSSASSSNAGADAGVPAAPSPSASATPTASASASATPTATPSASSTAAPTANSNTGAAGAQHANNASVDNDDDINIPLATTGGIASVLAAGLLSALAARRLKQRRKRRPGTRIAMPEPDAANLELELRMIENPLGLQDIDNALRSLQIWAEDTGAVLPELFALRLEDQEIALYLSEPADLPSPFVAASADRTAWVVLPSTATTPARESVSPYPALATIGVDDHGGVLMLDLEQIGSLNVVGDEDTARGVLNAIAVELAENPWSEQIEVTLVGMPRGLAQDLDRFRVQHVDDTAALVRNLRTSLAGREASFDSYGVDGVHSARTRATDAESWAPHVVILGQLPDEAVQRELQELVERVPRLGIATIANGETLGTGSIVRISSATSAELVSPGDVMPPLPFTPQVLQGRELELVQELFATTEQDSVAAPVTAPIVTVDAAQAADDALTDEAQQAEVSVVPSALSPESVTDSDVKASAGEDQPATASDDGDTAPVQPAVVADMAADVAAAPTDVPNAAPDVPTATETATAPDWPAPYVRMLGPVDVLHLADPDRLPGRGAELLTYLSLSAPVNGTMLQQAFWPDTVNAKDSQRKLVRLVRQALGADPDGTPLFPENKNQEGYQLHPAIGTDWHDFRRLIGDDLARTSNENLVTAIKLVRGTPFAGISTRRGWWAWISVLQEEMIAAVMDAADELARRALEIRDVNQARYAAGIAKAVEPLNEAGWRTELRAAMQDRDVDEINRIVDEMYARVGGGDPDYELDEETAELVDAATQ